MIVADMTSDTKPKPHRTQSSERPPTEMTSPKREQSKEKRSPKPVENCQTLGHCVDDDS